MIRLVAFILGCAAGYTLNGNLEMVTGKSDPTLKQMEGDKEVKVEKKQA